MNKKMVLGGIILNDNFIKIHQQDMMFNSMYVKLIDIKMKLQDCNMI